MEQRTFWELIIAWRVNRLPTFYEIHVSLPYSEDPVKVLIPSWMNFVQSLSSYFFKIHFSIILPVIQEIKRKLYFSDLQSYATIKFLIMKEIKKKTSNINYTSCHASFATWKKYDMKYFIYTWNYQLSQK
jgi:hypothetical protein